MYEAMSDVQSTSIAAIQVTTPSPTVSPCATTVGTDIGMPAIAPEVLVE